MKPGSYADRFSADEAQRYRDLGLWGDETLFDLLDRQARERPDKVFATDGTRSLTYRALHDSALGLAAGFHRRGWAAGDTVVVHLPNWVEFIEVAAGLARLGVIAVPVMPIYRRDEVGYVLANSDARAVITPASFKKFDYLGMYQSLRQQRPELEIVVARPDPRTDELTTDTASGICSLESVRSGDASAATTLPPQPSPDDPFVVVYTSGTTSRPKGCVHTFNTYCSGARSLTRAFDYHESDVQFGPSPITHTTGLVTSVLLPLLNGAGTHL